MIELIATEAACTIQVNVTFGRQTRTETLTFECGE